MANKYSSSDQLFKYLSKPIKLATLTTSSSKEEENFKPSDRKTNKIMSSKQNTNSLFNPKEIVDRIITHQTPLLTHENLDNKEITIITPRSENSNKLNKKGSQKLIIKKEEKKVVEKKQTKTNLSSNNLPQKTQSQKQEEKKVSESEQFNSKFNIQTVNNKFEISDNNISNFNSERSSQVVQNEKKEPVKSSYLKHVKEVENLEKLKHILKKEEEKTNKSTKVKSKEKYYDNIKLQKEKEKYLHEMQKIQKDYNELFPKKIKEQYVHVNKQTENKNSQFNDLFDDFQEYNIKAKILNFKNLKNNSPDSCTTVNIKKKKTDRHNKNNDLNINSSLTYNDAKKMQLNPLLSANEVRKSQSKSKSKERDSHSKNEKIINDMLYANGEELLNDEINDRDVHGKPNLNVINYTVSYPIKKDEKQIMNLKLEKTPIYKSKENARLHFLSLNNDKSGNKGDYHNIEIRAANINSNRDKHLSFSNEKPTAKPMMHLSTSGTKLIIQPKREKSKDIIVNSNAVKESLGKEEFQHKKAERLEKLDKKKKELESLISQLNSNKAVFNKNRINHEMEEKEKSLNNDKMGTKTSDMEPYANHLGRKFLFDNNFSNSPDHKSNVNRPTTLKSNLRNNKTNNIKTNEVHSSPDEINTKNNRNSPSENEENSKQNISESQSKSKSKEKKPYFSKFQEIIRSESPNLKDPILAQTYSTIDNINKNLNSHKFFNETYQKYSKTHTKYLFKHLNSTRLYGNRKYNDQNPESYLKFLVGINIILN